MKEPITATDIEDLEGSAVKGPASEPLLLLGILFRRPRRLMIQLTWDKDKADPLPDRKSFAEGTCEC